VGFLRVLCRVLLPLLLMVGLCQVVRAQPAVPDATRDASPDAALARLLAEARAAATPSACAKPDVDRLIRIFCNKQIRVGVRENYPLFGTRKDDVRAGYDIDVARAIAKALKIDVAFSRVTPANRIALLAEDRIDLTIATMGHNTQRDGQARFIRPHYYQSESILLGPRATEVKDWRDIAGRTICVTIGNGSNAQIVSQGARLMLFEDAAALPDRLRDATCGLAAQDDSFFAFHFTDAAFSERFERKFGFAQVPWGMAVAKTGSDKLASALDLISQMFHRDGVFIDIARANRVADAFLAAQREVWNRAACNTAGGSKDSSCVLPPLSAALQATPFAASITAFEAWVKQNAGVELQLPMLKTVPAWTLFKAGIINSLIMIAGALAATLGFALVLGAALGSHHRVARGAARALTLVMQSSPVVLTLVMAAAIAQAFFSYSALVALCAAILALGLMNGSNAAQAVAEAIATVRAEHGAAPIGHSALYMAAVDRSATQILSFLINAAKGTPVASFIGAPELLSALTDITAFASGRATTYTLLLVFYIIVVAIVVYFCGKLQRYLEQRRAAA
jgi:polar amino acid transport system substrate-binding protein